MMLTVGEKAPNFTSTDETGAKISLKDFKGKPVVLYFYPADDTPTCTSQACEFRDNFQRIKKAGAVILGVSPDSERSHQKFKTKYKLPFTLVVDEDKEICNTYGVWQEKTMFGVKYMGVVRTTFIIDARGKIAHIFNKVRVKGHVDAILTTLKEL